MSAERASAPATQTPGYRSAEYASSFFELGTPRHLPRCDGWILERRIPGSDATDAMGCYPLFACGDWTGLTLDLAELPPGLVSLVLVTDPLGDYDEASLARCFPDLTTPFKEHFVVELRGAWPSLVDPHHRRNARRALQAVEVTRPAAAAPLLDDWCELYANLVARHGIRGLTTFSRDAFARQLAVPGLAAYRATHEGRTVGITLWYVQGDVAYYHLGAYDADGYSLKASFALFQRALEDFASSGMELAALGAGAGASGDGGDGLTRFKRGWTPRTRTAYLCGRVLDRAGYEGICRERGPGNPSYFPAYRAGEFA